MPWLSPHRRDLMRAPQRVPRSRPGRSHRRFAWSRVLRGGAVTRALSTLTAADLRAITDAARSGALTRPYSNVALGRLFGSHRAPEAALELGALGLDPPQLG